MGLDRWDKDRCPSLEEERLLAAVRRVLGPQVTNLRIPPYVADERVDPMSVEANVGTPVRPFPRWLRCVKCGLLAAFDSDLFKIKEDRFRPENTHFVHANCEKGTKADAVPARFLMACRNGHLDDFPWHWFVHGGPSDCRGTLRFFELGASLQTENLWVKCDTCNQSRSLVQAFGREGRKNLPACRGRHPHLDTYESECSEEARPVLLGATNSWFPITLSVLAIPIAGDPVVQVVTDGWKYFEDVESEAETGVVLKTLKKGSTLPGVQVCEPGGTLSQSALSEEDLKRPEWDVLTSPSPPSGWPEFLSRKVDTPKELENILDSVLLLERLREVKALIGYTRVEAPEEGTDEDERPPMAALCKGSPEWVPACEVYGEGIFLRFNERAVRSWQDLPSVQDRNARMQGGHRGWRNARNLDPERGYPGIRYAMLHTLAHLLIRELALECGYNAASIRERVYASQDEAAPMAGVLIYTAAADSDGTLGGLVELGKPENLGRLVEQALNRASVCSSDPLCSEHDPSEDRSLHSASCHACTFVSETSCERGNRYLDRALLVETFESEDAAFFETILGQGSDDETVSFGTERQDDIPLHSVDSNDRHDRVISLEEIPDIIGHREGSIRVRLPIDHRFEIADSDGTAPFRFLREGEDISIDKGKVLILNHPDSKRGGTSVAIAIGKVIDVRQLINPETNDRMVQVTLRSGTVTYTLKLDETEFSNFRPLCVLDEG
jgi:hypothetical protein